MMSHPELTVISPGQMSSHRFTLTLSNALSGRKTELVTHLSADTPLQGRHILFAVPLDDAGCNHGLQEMLSIFRTHPEFLTGSVGGLVVDGTGDLYTKATARELVLSANRAGCLFIGRPLVEATGSLRNFTIQSKNADCSLEEAYHSALQDLCQRILTFEPPQLDRPDVLVLHASSHSKSNTYALWSRVKEKLDSYCDITEIGLRNGTLEDCSGCPYTMCLHYGEKGGCFYGGIMVKEVYPALRKANAVVMLCPNYNDALSANITAGINRLTALYRTTSFSDKTMYGIIVSGYSGSDIVARQLVSSLCMNKAFYLPPHFCMMETANDAGTAVKLPGIDQRLDDFATGMLTQLLGKTPAP